MPAMMDETQKAEALEEEEELEARGEETTHPEKAEAKTWIECQDSQKQIQMMEEVREAVEARPEWSMLGSKTL
jgi:hypothetical protein